MNNLAKNIYNALQFLDPDCDQETWMKIGTALKSEGDEYLADWDRWSSGGSSYKTGECDRRWKHLQANTVNIGTLFHLAKQNDKDFELDRDNDSDNSIQSLKQRTAAEVSKQKAEAEEKAKKLKSLPSLEERDRKIRQQPKTLAKPRNADLLRRGLNQDELNFTVSQRWLFDLQGGYGISAIDPVNGLLCGAQRANDDRSKAKYTWWEKFAGKTHLRETDENPLFVWISPDFDSSKPCEIHYEEKALGSLIYAFMQWRTNKQIIVIGAAGGQFGKQALIRVLGALPKTDKHILFPDAGSVINKGVYKNYKKLEQHLESLGISLQVADWGQFAITKADGGKDCDELGANFNYSLIHSSAYFTQNPEFLKDAKPRISGFWFTKKFRKSKKRSRQDFAKLPEVQASTYEQGDRIDAWTEIFKRSKNILDASFTGSGKSHKVGELHPEMFKEFGITRLIYVYNDPRNVSTHTLKDWTLVPSRHNGITDKQGQLRRATSKDDELVTHANCSRTEAINALRSKGITNDKTICDTCPMLNACRHASGDGYGFKYQRAIALKADRLICHPLALPHPDEFDYSTTLLIFEEPSESFNVQRQVKVTVKDIDKIIVKLAEVNLIADFMPMLQSIKDLLGDRSLRYGFDYHAIKSAIPDKLPSKKSLGNALKPDLSILDTMDSIDDSEFENAKGKDKQQLAKINALLKRETQLHSIEVQQIIQNDVPTQWLPDFLDIITGGTSGDLNIQHGTLTITIADYQLRMIASKSAKNLFLDATLHSIDLEMKLGAPVTVVKQSGDMPMARVIQVPDLDRMGKQRGDEQTRRKDAIVSHIKAKHPNKIVKVIDFKSNEADGAWWRDSRGSNNFADADILIIVGTPCRNVASLKAEYSVLTRLHPDKDDQDFAAWVDRKIRADIQQGFGRKSGNRFRRGDEIYFISDFELGDIPHEQIKAGDITPDAMSKTEQTEKWICDHLTEFKNQGVDLLSMSGREIQRLLGISHGQYERFKNSAKSWIGLLYNYPNSNPIQDLNEIESMRQISDLPPISIAAIATNLEYDNDEGKDMPYPEPLANPATVIAPSTPKIPNVPTPNSKSSNKPSAPPKNAIQWQKGMSAMYQGTDWVIGMLGTATAKIVRNGFELWVDIVYLEYA